MIGKGNVRHRLKKPAKIGAVIFSMVLALFVGAGIFSDRLVTVDAADGVKTVDDDTTNNWEGVVSPDGSASTQNVGRIWTDKSVFDGADGYTFSAGLLDGDTVTVEESDGDKSDFLVALSALGSTSNLKTTTTTTTPLDIVLVLDVSGSMDDNLENYTYLPVYNIQNGWNTTYYASVNGIYTKLTYKFLGSYWTLNGERVSPKTGADDEDPDHIQFYTRRSQSSEKKMNALKNAVNSFISAMEEANDQVEDPNDQSRIAIVKFADDSYRYTIGNDRGAGGSSDYNYTQVVSDFTADTESLSSDINDLTAGGATAADYGMTLAEDVLKGGSYGSENNRGTYTGARSDAKKIIVFFTDGEPNHSNNWDGSVANDTIEKAKDIKESGATIYTIGVFSDANPYDTAGNFNGYMHGVSSNYPNATAYNNLGDRVSESDYYKAASSSDELSAVFDEIFQSESESVGSGSPIEEEEQEGAQNTPGYLTFTDTLGKYMEVSGSQMYLAFADTIYTGTTSDDGATWNFTGVIEDPNAVYPSGDLSGISIQVTKSEDLSQGDTITVRIPASLIPMRNYNVDTNQQTMEVTAAYPVRLFYGVSVKDAAIAAMNNPADSEYAALMGSQTAADSQTVDFYSNSFTAGADAGLTTAEFTPSDGNRFYYYTENTYLYTDEACTQQAKRDTIGAYSTLYYKDTYWQQDGTVAAQVTSSESITRGGTSWSSVIQYDTDGNAYIPAGTHRSERPGKLAQQKGENSTETAGNVLSPAWGAGENFIVSLGNNGRISYSAPGQIEIKKTVDWGNASEQTKTEKNTFSFAITLKDAEGNPLSGSYPYYINGSSDVAGFVEISSGEGTVPVSGGQTVAILGLPAGAEFTVVEEEANKNGFVTTDATSNAEEAASNIAEDGRVSGTVHSGTQTSLTFHNAYYAQDADLPEGTILVQKILNGREWREDDAFIFEIDSAEAPMPASEQIQVGSEDADHTVSFGAITFSNPGTYTYSITEDNDTNPIAGISYSGAAYEVTVTVTDNGSGNLEIGSVTVLQEKDDAGELLADKQEIEGTTVTFTNTYNADNGTTNINGRKEYTDLSGANPLTNGKFTFELKALGGYDTETGSDADLTVEAASVPMPAGKNDDNAVTTVNTSNTFGFPTITYTGDHVGNTYVYQIREVGGTESGMTYDETVYNVKVAVSEVTDEDGTHIIASVDKQPADIVFRNTYDPEDAVLEGDNAIHGTKILQGRDLNEGEAFHFTLSALNDNAKTVLPEPQTVTVGSLTDRMADFGFDTLTFSKAGTYTFTVSETGENGTPAADSDGLSYSKNTCTVTVQVTDTRNGTLQVSSVTYVNSLGSTDSTKAVFTNVYEAELDYGAEGGISITKLMTDRPMEADDFTFTITGADEASEELLTDSDRSFGNTAAAENEMVTMNKLQSLTFDQDDAGKTYSFTVAEEVPSEKLAGVVYDLTQYRVDIHVADHGDGTMHALTTVTKITDQDGTSVNEAVLADADTDAQPYTAPVLSFENDYDPEPAVVGESAGNALQVTKTVTGAPSPDDVSYSFTLTAVGDNTGNIEGLGPDSTLSVSTSGVIREDESQTVSFSELKFSEPGTYAFTVQENAPETDEGWTYDTAVRNITVSVTDISSEGTYDGKLHIESISGNNPTVTNRYSAAETVVGDDEAQLQITKNVTGAPALSEYEFNLKLVSGDRENVLTGTGENRTEFPETGITVSSSALQGTEGSETVSFGSLTFTAEGVYTFEAAETTEQEADGWTYDNDAKTITVTVTDEGYDGQLDAVVEGNNPTVTNSYVPGSVTTGTETLGNPQVTKTVTGAPATEEFRFTLQLTSDNADGVIGLEEGNSITKTTESLSGAAAPSSESVDFGELTFTRTGDYVFTVKEDTTASASGWTYDNTSYTITYHVTDEGYDGQLDAAVEGNNPTVTNSYEASEYTGVPAGFTFTKVFEGHAWTEDYSFTFELSPVDGAPMPADTDAASGIKTVTVAAPTESDGETAKFDFGEITYTETGTYRYKVKETVSEANSGIAYDLAERTVTVTVTDLDDQGTHTGQLAASVTEINGGSEFRNVYSTGTVDYDAAVGLRVTKNLAGHDIDADAFAFTMAPDNEEAAAKMAEPVTEKVKGSSISVSGETFGTAAETVSMHTGLVYTQEDAGKEFAFTVYESQGGDTGKGYTNDSTVHRVTFAVSDNGSGTLTVITYVDGDAVNTVTSSDQGADTVPVTVTFNNSYSAGEEILGADGDSSINAFKQLANRDLADGEFTFGIVNVKAPETVIAGGTNAADGTVTFDSIHYTLESMLSDAESGLAEMENVTDDDGVKHRTFTYQYKVYESVRPEGVTSDDVTVNDGAVLIEVAVKDNNDGTLSIEVIYPDGEDGIVFSNTYGNGASAVQNIRGGKVYQVYGTDNAPDITGKYTFTLTGSDGAPMPERTETVNDAAGNVDFGNVTYTMENVFGSGEGVSVDEEGRRTRTFTYTVEEKGQAAGVENDPETVKTFTVTVTDNGNGTISVAEESQADDLRFVFTNTYSVDPVEVSVTGEGGLSVTKNLDGRDLKDGEFTFWMKDMNGNSVSEGLVQADGTVSFGTVRFDHTGTYQYEIGERNNALGGVSYDSARFMVIAEVTDNQDGTLAVTWSACRMGKNLETVVFSNAYTAAPARITLGAVKVLNGRKLTEGEFTFLLKDADGNTVDEASNSADGSVLFGELTYEQPGTYRYTVSEETGNAENVTYDDSVYTVTVTVSDDLNGSLSAQAQICEGDAAADSIVFVNTYTEPEKPAETPEPQEPVTGNWNSPVPYAAAITLSLAGIAAILIRRIH